MFKQESNPYKKKQRARDYVMYYVAYLLAFVIFGFGAFVVAKSINF